MAKSRVHCTIDSDLADKFKGDCSDILNSTLRSMVSTNISIPYYAKQEKECVEELDRIRESLEKVNEIVTKAEKQLEVFKPRQEQLIEKQLYYETKLAENRKYLETNEISSRKLELTMEINNAIRSCNYILEDVIRAVDSQIKEMKNLVPSFDIEKQIELIKDWD